MKTLALLVAPLALAAASLAAGGSRAPDEAAVAVVEAFERALLSVAWAERSADHEEIVSTLKPAVREHVDTAALSRAWLGERWDAIDAVAQTRVADAACSLIASAYSARLRERGDGQRFSVPEYSTGEENVAVVRSVLGSGDESLAFEFHLRRAGEGGWKIIRLVGQGAPFLTATVGPAPEEGDVGALVGWIEDRAARYGESPTQVIARLQDGLLDVMRGAKDLGFEGRFAALVPLIGDTHDLPVIARLSLSRAWRELDHDGKERFRDVFRRLSITTYAARFEGFSGETFERTVAEATRRGGVLVKTTLTKSDGDNVQLDYLMHRAGGKWLVINVIAEGVSDLAVKRSEYKTIIDEDGLSVLIGLLEDQIARLEAGHEQ